ncbi:MAG: hypothetical protein ACOC5U_03880 [Candidatus Aminicenantaceae bacterium]
MVLTLNQFLLLVLTIAAVVAVTYLVLFLHQMRKTAREGSQALLEIRELARSLNETNRKVSRELDDVGEFLEASKKTAVNLSEAAFFVTTRIVKPGSKFMPFLFPLIRFGWRLMKKKKKEDKNER